jgi:hypothetical protein
MKPKTTAMIETTSTIRVGFMTIGLRAGEAVDRTAFDTVDALESPDYFDATSCETARRPASAINRSCSGVALGMSASP